MNDCYRRGVLHSKCLFLQTLGKIKFVVVVVVVVGFLPVSTLCLILLRWYCGFVKILNHV